MAAKKKAGAKKPSKVTSITKAKRKLPPQLEANKWKPGQSGNPKGRPKQQDLETVLREYLQEELDLEGERITRLDAMVRVIFSEGVTKRNAKILVAIMDRLYPKPIIIRGDENAPIVLKPPDLSHVSTKDLKAITAMRKKIAAGASDE